MLIVYVICGAALILTSIGMIFFMKDNTPVKESYLPLNKWLELVSNKYTGRFLTSTFFILGTVVSFLLGFIPNYLATVGISLATSSFYYLVTAFSSCFVAAIIKGRYGHVLTSKVRVIISSTCVIIGLLLFALIPTAKVLLIACALVGISLGIHDFYYLYVLFLLANNRIRANLRKASEMSFMAGLLFGIPVFAIALMLDVRIVFVVAVVILCICAFMYPVSSFSNDVDDKDPTLRKEKKASPKKPAQGQAPAQQAPVPEPQPQAADLYAVPEGYDQAYEQYMKAMEAPVDDGYGDPYTDDGQYYDPNQGGYDNGYVE